MRNGETQPETACLFHEVEACFLLGKNRFPSIERSRRYARRTVRSDLDLSVRYEVVRETGVAIAVETSSRDLS